MPKTNNIIRARTTRGQTTRELDKNSSLSVAEQHFLTNYIQLGNIIEAVIATPELYHDGMTRNACSNCGGRILARPNVQAELKRITEEARTETTATAREVMEYFTKVMRGEITDQFGLEAPLAERTRAAQELAKRTIDIENRQSGTPDQTIEIKLDWSRSK